MFQDIYLTLTVKNKSKNFRYKSHRLCRILGYILELDEWLKSLRKRQDLLGLRVGSLVET